MLTITTETLILHIKGDVQNGTSKAGKAWAKREAVFKAEDAERYIAVTLFGDDEVGMLDGIEAGSKCRVEYYASSREWNGRWYTDLRLVAVTEDEEHDLPFD